MLALVVLFLLAILPAAIAADKGRSFLGWYLYGVLLLPVAIVHALLAAPDQAATDRRQLERGMRKCPFCAEIVRGEAVVCRFCGKDLPPPEPSEEDLARGYRVRSRGLSAEEIEAVRRPAPPSALTEKEERKPRP